jgi:V/A-type H+-transporting ATPase subunit A
MVFLQQDAFDSVDASTPLERQRESLDLIHALITRRYDFADKEAARNYFTRLTGTFKNFNYAAVNTPDYARLKEQLTGMLSQT